MLKIHTGKLDIQGSPLIDAVTNFPREPSYLGAHHEHVELSLSLVLVGQSTRRRTEEENKIGLINLLLRSLKLILTFYVFVCF